MNRPLIDEDREGHHATRSPHVRCGRHLRLRQQVFRNELLKQHGLQKLGWSRQSFGQKRKIKIGAHVM